MPASCAVAVGQWRTACAMGPRAAPELDRRSPPAEIGGMRETSDWLTVPEIAAELGVDPSTVRRWIRTHRLRAQAIVWDARPTTTFRVRRRDFETFRRARVRDTINDDWE